MIDVNLLPDQSIAERRDLKIKAFATLVMIVATGLTILTAVGIFSLKAYQTAQITNLERRKTIAKDALTNLSKEADTLLTLKKKAKGIESINKNKYNFKTAFAYVTGLVPASVGVDTVTINSDGLAALSVSSEDMDKVAGYIRKLATDTKLKDAHLARLSVSDDKRIVLSVDSKYGK